MTSTAARTGRTPAPLIAAWLITALVCGPVGFLLFALSERSGDRLLGVVLTGGAVLAGVTAAVLFAKGDVGRAWSLALSGAFVVLGVVAAGVTLTGTAAFASDALLVALPPLVGGLATATFARRR